MNQNALSPDLPALCYMQAVLHITAARSERSRIEWSQIAAPFSEREVITLFFWRSETVVMYKWIQFPGSKYEAVSSYVFH